MNEREQALQCVSEALPVFEEINNVYATATSLNQQVMAKQAVTKAARGKTAPIAAWLATAACFFIMDVIYMGVILRLKSGFMMVAWIVLAIALCIYVNRKVKKTLRDKDVYSKDDMAALEQQMDAYSEEVCRISAENQEIINRIPRDYRYYQAVAYLESVLANGRADSMKEALNLYETYLHQQALEENSRRTLMMNQQQCQMMANIEANSQSAARDANLASTFSILNFLSK